MGIIIMVSLLFFSLISGSVAPPAPSARRPKFGFAGCRKRLLRLGPSFSMRFHGFAVEFNAFQWIPMDLQQ